MPPEQAAQKAAETLDKATENAHDFATAGALVGIADGWTRLYTALAHTPSALPLMTNEPVIRVGEGGEEALARDVEWGTRLIADAQKAADEKFARDARITARVASLCREDDTKIHEVWDDSIGRLIAVPDKARELLVEIGWTPPTDDV